jgi:hypothetical protein
MQMKTLTLTLILMLSFSVVIGLASVSLARANPYSIMVYKSPPIVSIQSPQNSTAFNVNNFLLNFTVTKPEGWLIYGGFSARQVLISFDYELDEAHSNKTYVENDLSTPTSYSLQVTNLTEGEHSLKVYAYAFGWTIELHGFWETAEIINGSSNPLMFSVDTKPPQISILPIVFNDTTKIPLDFSLDEPTSQISYSLDNQPVVLVTGNTTLSNLASGTHNVTVYATDLVGNNANSQTEFFTINEPSLFQDTFTLLVTAAVVAAITVVVIVFYLNKHKKYSR